VFRNMSSVAPVGSAWTPATFCDRRLAEGVASVTASATSAAPCLVADTTAAGLAKRMSISSGYPSGRAAGANTVECGSARLAVSGAAPAGAAVAVALRPERVLLDPTVAVDTELAMTVAHVVYQGETVRYILKNDAGLELQALELGEVRFATGARVRAGWAAADARIIQEVIA
jgi:hypothetical protein